LAFDRFTDRKNQIFLAARAIILATIWLVLTPFLAASQQVIEPRPGWVVEYDFPRLSDDEIRSQSGSFYSLLVDHQLNLGLETFYSHSTVIWIPYFFLSERIKRTFVERRPSHRLHHEQQPDLF
jgi:hypothetical protein